MDWRRGHSATTKDGRPCGPLDTAASDWCAVGYVYKLLDAYTPLPLPYGVIHANDKHGPLAAAAELRKLLGESE